MNLKTKLNQPGFLLIVLVIFAIAALVLGFGQIMGTIRSPFSQFKQKAELVTEEDLANYLKKQDTDKDGLSDYDEQYVYKTSAYLIDSDSDSYTDFEEVEAKSNPLDPQSTPYRKGEEQGSALERILTSSPSPAQELGQEISIPQIRELLVEAGLDPAIVDKVDDKTLIELYNETKKEVGTSPQSTGQISSQSSELKPEEIRQFLLLAGVDPKVLEQVDDETLKTLFEEMIMESR